MDEPSQLGGPKGVHYTPRYSPSQVHRWTFAAVKLKEEGTTWLEDAQNLTDRGKNEIFTRQMLQYKIAEDEVGGIVCETGQIRTARA